MNQWKRAPMDESKQTGKGGETVGKVLFYLTFVAVLVFFWWLLLYDHGVAPVHH